MRRVVSAFLFPCLAMAACLRADAAYTFGDAGRLNLTMQVSEKQCVPLYLTLSDEYLDWSKDLLFSEILVTISVLEPNYDPDAEPTPLDPAAGLAGVAPNALLGDYTDLGFEIEEASVFFGENGEGFGSASDLTGSPLRVLIATLCFEAIKPGQVTFLTDYGDETERVVFSDGSGVHPSNAELTITVLPTAVPLPAACWGGLALLGITVAARLRSALR